MSYKQVANVQPKFGLLVCDEAHRLKNLEAKTSQMLNTFSIDRRILLTGTPIQNNLLEFHAMMDLVAPELLGNQKTFKRVFANPIIKGRTPNCSSKDLEEGKDRYESLMSITKEILLRRTAEILSDYLPPKYEQVVFCSPTLSQIQIYQELVNSERVNEIVRGSALQTVALTAIAILRKLCNSPELLVKNLESDGSEGQTTKALLGGIEKHLPKHVTNVAELSGTSLNMIFPKVRFLHLNFQSYRKAIVLDKNACTDQTKNKRQGGHCFGEQTQP